MSATDAPEAREHCPRCRQHDPTAPPSAIAAPGDWWCERCKLRAVDGEDAAAWVGTVKPGEILERLHAAQWRGEDVDGDRFAVAIGRYYDNDLHLLLADFLHNVRGSGCLANGTDGDMARRLIAALAAGGFAVVSR